MSQHNPEISPDHYSLADLYSAKRVADFLRKRDGALSRLYFLYGLAVAVHLTGWTKPTVMQAVRRHQAASTTKKGKKP